MSDTPRTEAALKASRNQFDALQKLTSEAAKLERENAELREKLQIEEERSMYWRKAARKEAQP